MKKILLLVLALFTVNTFAQSPIYRNPFTTNLHGPTGTNGQVLIWNGTSGNWYASNATAITTNYLPLAGGTLTGPVTNTSSLGIGGELYVGGSLRGTLLTLNISGSITNFVVDMNGTVLQMITATNHVALTNVVNAAAGASITLLIDANGANRNLWLPVGWKCLGCTNVNVVTNGTVWVLDLLAYGTHNTNNMLVSAAKFIANP